MGDLPRRLILHCGLPKSATSALQDWLRAAAAPLAEIDAAYPGPFLALEAKQAFLLPALRQADKVAEITASLRQSQAKTVIWSHEGLSNHLDDLDPLALAAFRQLTSDIDVTTVVVRRRSQDWLRSYHKQCVLNPSNGASPLWGTALSCEELSAHPRVKRLLDVETLSGDLACAFGAQSHHILDYDDPDWFWHFQKLIGFRQPKGALPKVNTGLPDWMIEVLRQINAHTTNKARRLAWRQAIEQRTNQRSATLTAAATQKNHQIWASDLDLLRPDPNWSSQERAAFGQLIDDLKRDAIKAS